ncbi:Pyruvate dehydrogenase E1 component subunit alpha-3, partial [Nymphaea thermarum]
EKAHYASRDPIVALKKYIIENNLATESELKAIEKKIDEVIEDAVEFADQSPLPPRSQLLENVFADPKGFGICPDGRYRCVLRFRSRSSMYCFFFGMVRLCIILNKQLHIIEIIDFHYFTGASFHPYRGFLPSV